MLRSIKHVHTGISRLSAKVREGRHLSEQHRFLWSGNPAGLTTWHCGGPRLHEGPVCCHASKAA